MRWTETDDKYLELIESGDFIHAGSMHAGLLSDAADEMPAEELFSRVWQMRDRENWNEIDRFMGREYLCDWLDFKTSRGELTDRSLVFRGDDEPDLDADDAPLDNIIRDKARAFLTRHEICDLYDLVYLCSHRFNEIGPDVKGLLHTILDYCDERHLAYILATQYDPSLEESDLKELYVIARERLGLPTENDPRVALTQG